MIEIEIPFDAPIVNIEALLENAEELHENPDLPYWELWPKIAEKWTSELAHHLGISLVYKEIKNPQPYEHDNHRVFATISEEDLSNLWVKARLSTVQEKYQDRFAPRSGFIPFSRFAHFPSSLPPSQWASVQLYCLIEAILEHHPTDSQFEDVMQEFIFNLVGEYYHVT